MRKKFLIKVFFLALAISSIPLSAIYFDTFNVFHWKNIRFTKADPNKNYIKTQYIVHNPKKFNAFVFGSSRVGAIPKDALPKTLGGDQLHWYNMTNPHAIPSEHYYAIQTFEKNGVDIKMILLAFDDISMFSAIEHHYNLLLTIPYKVYEENKFNFYKPYLIKFTAPSIMKEVLLYDPEKYKDKTEAFYSYGDTWGSDFSLTENPKMEQFKSFHTSTYTQKNAHMDIEKISKLCQEKGIKLVLITNPLYKATYLDSVRDGYFDFLRLVANSCEFYNFSTLNNYTLGERYFLEGSHYCPALGLIIEKYLFGSEEERQQIRDEAGDELFGVKVSSENVDFVIGELKKQLEKLAE